MPKYKASLHIHASEDHREQHVIRYSVYELIEHAHRKGFKVLALTFHQHFGYKKVHGLYAQQKGILLIPGIEANLYNYKKDHENHVLILNCDQEVEKLETFDDLRKYRKEHPEIFVIAPHIFSGFNMSMGKKKFEEHVDLFDAVEHSWVYTKRFNPNKKAEQIARKYKKPFIATADLHNLKHFMQDYTIIDSPSLKMKDVINSLKQGKIINVTRPKKILDLLHTAFITYF